MMEHGKGKGGGGGYYWDLRLNLQNRNEENKLKKNGLKYFIIAIMSWRLRALSSGPLAGVLTVGKLSQLILAGTLRDVFIVDDKHDDVSRLVLDWGHEYTAQKAGTCETKYKKKTTKNNIR